MSDTYSIISKFTPAALRDMAELQEDTRTFAAGTTVRAYIADVERYGAISLHRFRDAYLGEYEGTGYVDIFLANLFMNGDIPLFLEGMIDKEALSRHLHEERVHCIGNHYFLRERLE